MMKLAWLCRVFEGDDERLYDRPPAYCYSKCPIVYMEVEEWQCT